jgi:simple sugar transport system ATP-binding protein
VIELQHISKRFGALQALEDVSLAVVPGKILGLLGENGAGKSTLMNVLFGLVRPTSGRILAGGREVRIGSPRGAQRLGIGMVHQHFTLVPTLTVLENLALFLRRAPARMRPAATELLRQLGWMLPLDERVERLAVGQQQRTEILKALLTIRGGGDAGQAQRSGAVLILDEPTAVLTPQESQELFSAMRSLRDATQTAVIFISHKLAEIREVCDELAILRRGRLVHAAAAGELSAAELAEKMVGGAVPALRPAGREDGGRRGERVVLALRDYTTEVLRAVSLELRAGEVLGIAGVDGNGQSELAQAILGISGAPRGGVMMLQGEEAGGHQLRWWLDRIASIAEDRQREALVMPLSVMDNLLLKDYRRAPFCTRAAPLRWLRFGRWRSQARRLIADFDVRTTSMDAPVGRLSGGNQQKVVLARELEDLKKPLVVAVNPTRGLDVGASAFVFRRLLEARDRGAAILLIHSDLDELLAVSDQVAVMFAGRLQGTDWPATTKEAIGRRMLGLAE